MNPSFTKIPLLRLKKGQERRLKEGHLWIYSNEVDVAYTPLSAFQAGDIVQIQSSQGDILGFGYTNPHTLLCTRLLTTDHHPIDYPLLIRERLEKALKLRTHYFSYPFYRLVYGESDGLPGLIVDRYGDWLAVQITTAGMERMKTAIVENLQVLLRPEGILWRNDHSFRATEGLSTYIEIASGTVPATVEIYENNARFEISLWKGQKTGWFYDHRENRRWVTQYTKDKAVLDLFSYVGAWSIQTAIAGATEVTAIDSSIRAMQWLQHNATLNGMSDRIVIRPGEVLPELKKLQEEGKTFDVIISDPPAFIKRRKDLKAGAIAYQRLNEMAMRLIKKPGLFISASCSMHWSVESLIEVTLRSSIKLKRKVQILGQGHQGSDHPIHPAIPETNYLKAIFCYIT